MSKFWNGNIGEFSWLHFMPVKQWYDVIGEKTVADAILDRIVHVAQRIELKGDSLRKRKSEVENAEE